MVERFKLEGTPRSAKAQVVRRAGAVPAILYGHNLAPQSLEVNSQVFGKLFQKAGSTSLIMLSVGDTQHPVLVREVQYHPLKNTVRHIDFYQVRMDEEIEASVPLSFIGESPAVKDQGGVLVRNLDELAVKALPQNLPHNIEVDISGLNTFEKVVHVSDLKLPEGVTVLAETETVVALVQPPRTEEELEQLDEAVTEDVEAVEGVKPAEEPAEGEEAAAESAEAEPGEKPEEKKGE